MLVQSVPQRPQSPRETGPLIQVPATHVVVNEKSHPFLGVVEAQKPLEEQGQERRGLL